MDYGAQLVFKYYSPNWGLPVAMSHTQQF